MSTVGQSQQFAFEKEGRFIAPEQRLTLSSVRGIDAYEGPQPFDMLHYRLDITLPMTFDALEGTARMIMRLKEN
ncbi:MAG: hypothetical protein KF749_14575, partial [Bacteroidetes bacterium]|nr:hypothetical protein [Bacteroidota bacterium]